MDNELDNTVQDIFNKAKHPESLRVFIANQDSEPYEYKGEYNVDIINITPEQSDGYSACRQMTIDNFDEDYYFQIAPHSRLAQDFDETLIKHYDSKTGKRILVHRQHDFHLPNELDGKPYFESQITHWSAKTVTGRRKLPIKSKELFQVYAFLAGGVFCKADWLDEVGYNTNIFLWGEETDLSIRTYAKGFDMWHLPEPVSFHLYHQQNRKALGRDNEPSRYTLRNNSGLQYVFDKIISNDYDKAQEWAELNNLDFTKLQAEYGRFTQSNQMPAKYINEIYDTKTVLASWINNKINGKEFVKALDTCEKVRELLVKAS